MDIQNETDVITNNLNNFVLSISKFRMDDYAQLETHWYTVIEKLIVITKHFLINCKLIDW